MLPIPLAMSNSAKLGRPAKQRNRVAGEHLRQALKVLGKGWRKNTKDPDHVLNWSLWTVLGLPRSANTIDADIRLGVPEERLAAYAQCLGLSPRTFGAPDTDIRSELGACRQPGGVARPPLDLGFGASFQGEYRGYNSREYLQNLFELVGGVYRVHYVLPIAGFVNRCAFWFCCAEEHCIRARGLFVRFGLENFFEANLFRWHNNLHASYLCHNSKELGHFLLVDPLRHNLIARREPFWLKGHGVTDNGLADNAPVPFTFRMERLPTPAHCTTGAWWDQECDDLRRRPTVLPADADHDALRAAVLTPDALI
jgi:hypothetical protein